MGGQTANPGESTQIETNVVIAMTLRTLTGVSESTQIETNVLYYRLVTSVDTSV